MTDDEIRALRERLRVTEDERDTLRAEVDLLNDPEPESPGPYMRGYRRGRGGVLARIALLEGLLAKAIPPEPTGRIYGPRNDDGTFGPLHYHETTRL